MGDAVIADPLLGIDHETVGEKKKQRRILKTALFLVLILVGISGFVFCFLYFLTPIIEEQQLYDLIRT